MNVNEKNKILKQKLQKSTWKRKNDGKGYFDIFRPISPIRTRKHK